MRMSRNDNASLELESESDSVRMMIVCYPPTYTLLLIQTQPGSGQAHSVCCFVLSGRH